MSRDLSEISCLVVPKNFLKETFCDLVQISPGTEKIWIRGGSMKIFR